MEVKHWLIQKKKLLEEMGPLLKHAFAMEKEMLQSLSREEIFAYLVSKENFCQRKQLYSYKDLVPSFRVRVGDICFIDFGQAYQMEIGYLHFGLILSFKHAKAFVVPMTGKKILKPDDHRMSLGNIEGLAKESVLFLNDAKWINTARIIDVKGHISVQSEKFKLIQERVIDCILS